MIDSLIFILTCEHCNETEKSRILDKGNGWNGSAWGFSADFLNFETTWSGGGDDVPKLLSATCKKCGSKDIKIQSDFKV